jgi:hypothetical protein
LDGGRHAEARQHARLEPLPVTNVVETDGVGEQGEEHRGKMTQHREGAGLGYHACGKGVAVDHSARNEVENLLEDDHIGPWLVLFGS